MTTSTNLIEVKQLGMRFDTHWIHQGVSFDVKRGEILAIVGGSGSGKTTLLRELLLLTRPATGSIRLFNKELLSATSTELLAIQRRLGVLFQQNALFSSLTLLENIAFPLKEHTSLDNKTIHDLALLKLALVGLPTESAVKLPAELSGGMQKRAALARAIALDPDLLFLDEPTAGLDPTNATIFDELILNLQATMGLTIVMVTHDLDTLWGTADRALFLGEKKLLCLDTVENVSKNPHALIQTFFGGSRGRKAEKSSKKNDQE